jgi:hypothetical protein
MSRRLKYYPQKLNPFASRTVIKIYSVVGSPAASLAADDEIKSLLHTLDSIKIIGGQFSSSPLFTCFHLPQFDYQNT